jgi:hypothetical protein
VGLYAGVIWTKSYAKRAIGASAGVSFVVRRDTISWALLTAHVSQGGVDGADFVTMAPVTFAWRWDRGSCPGCPITACHRSEGAETGSLGALLGVPKAKEDKGAGEDCTGVCSSA